jgi:acyl-CoA thioesterase-1
MKMLVIRLCIGIVVLASVLLQPQALAVSKQWNPENRSFRKEPIKILFFGDTILSGYGLPDNQDSAPSIISRKLEQNYYFDNPLLFKDLSHPGMTTANAVTRIKEAINLKPDIVVLALGTADAMQGVDPDIIFNNLDTILGDLQRSGIYTLLVGLQAPLNTGYNYISKFNAVYGKLSQRYPLTFMPFLRAGVAGDRMLLREDGIHPNAHGHEVIAANLSQYLHRMGKSIEQQKRDIATQKKWRSYMRMRNRVAAERGLPPRYTEEEIKHGFNPGHH